MRADDGSNGPRDTLWTSLFLFGFGVAVVAFLVVIDRHEWMAPRSASGAPTAISYASRGSGLQ